MRADAHNILDKFLHETGSIRGVMERPSSAYHYAMIMQMELPEAEQAILESSEYAYYYALNVLRSRWPEAEETILRDVSESGGHFFAIEYATNVYSMNSDSRTLLPWPELEERILEVGSPSGAQGYVSRILGEPWPEGERLLMLEPQIARWYAKGILKDRFLAYEYFLSQYPSETPEGLANGDRRKYLRMLYTQGIAERYEDLLADRTIQFFIRMGGQYHEAYE